MDAVTLEMNIPSILPVASAEAEMPMTPAPTVDPVVENQDDIDIAAMFAATKKKKKKPKVADPTDAPVGDPCAPTRIPSEDEDTEELTYDQMLSRIYEKMGTVYTASELALKRLQRPKMAMIGSKRVGWINFGKTAQTLNRSEEHLASFIEAEFGTTVSIDAKNALVIKGRFGSEQIESVLKKYVEQYIKCRTCKSMDTKLVRDPDSRLYFLKCETCQSQWSVSAIQKGFHATMKGDRRAARAAE
jgi:translation initiation factor 2 subunit 2